VGKPNFVGQNSINSKLLSFGRWASQFSLSEIFLWKLWSLGD